MSVIKVSKKTLNDIDMSGYVDSIKWSNDSQYFDKPAGDEYYRFLVHLSKSMPSGSRFVDIGTYYGMAAAALAANEECNVITYDIYDHITDNPDTMTIKKIPNIECFIKDCVEDEAILAGADLIVMDIDPHDGNREREVFDKLRAVGFKGIVVLDDINLTDGIKTFWKEIAERKEDITGFGHWSGTGIVYFGDRIRLDFEKE